MHNGTRLLTRKNETQECTTVLPLATPLNRMRSGDADQSDRDTVKGTLQSSVLLLHRARVRIRRPSTTLTLPEGRQRSSTPGGGTSPSGAIMAWRPHGTEFDSCIICFEGPTSRAVDASGTVCDAPL